MQGYFDLVGSRVILSFPALNSNKQLKCASEIGAVKFGSVNVFFIHIKS